jgi:Zn-dependent peptidase ImmA (M78 family)
VNRQPPADADAAVIAAAAQAIRHVQSRGILYADLFSPLHDDGLRDALRRLTISVRGESLGTQDIEAVSPPVYGRYLMLYSTDVDDSRRRFALRHGMGHVAAGHVSEVAYLSNRNDFMSHDERVADLFAIADLFPWCDIAGLREHRSTWRVIEDHIVRLLRRLTFGWPEERISDRARLRILLFRRVAL